MDTSLFFEWGIGGFPDGNLFYNVSKKYYYSNKKQYKFLFSTIKQSCSQAVLLHSLATFLVYGFEKNSLKKVRKMPKGFFRDQRILHHLLKLDDLDRLLIQPVAGSSFEFFVIEEVIRGFQCTLQAGIDFNFYRTRDKSEIDFIVDGSFGLIPIEIKLGTKVNQRMLSPLKSFLKETASHFGILVNNSEKIEMIADNIIQIPAMYL